MIIYQEKIAPPRLKGCDDTEPAVARSARRTIFYSLRLENTWLKAQFARLTNKWK